MATYKDVHDYNDRLDEYTMVAFKRRRVSIQFIQKLEHSSTRSHEGHTV